MITEIIFTLLAGVAIWCMIKLIDWFNDMDNN